jgi:hypothetical protein
MRAAGLESVVTERNYFSETYLAFQADIAMLSFDEMRRSMKAEDPKRYGEILEEAEQERTATQKRVANQLQRCMSG